MALMRTSSANPWPSTAPPSWSGPAKVGNSSTGFAHPSTARARAYLFRTTDDGATYGQMAKLTATDAAAADSFGWSVAFDSGTVVVGAYGDDDACTDDPDCNSGAAYVYSLSDGGLVYSKLTASDAAKDDYFSSPWPSTVKLSWSEPTPRTYSRARPMYIAQATAAPLMIRWPS